MPYDRVVTGLRQVADYGKTKRVKVLIENHIGYTSNIDALVEILKRANHPNLRAVMDWGNGKGGAGDPLAQRKDLVKEKEISEDEERRAADEVQKLTDKFVADIDKALEGKETDLMAV